MRALGGWAASRQKNGSPKEKKIRENNSAKKQQHIGDRTTWNFLASLDILTHTTTNIHNV